MALALLEDSLYEVITITVDDEMWAEVVHGKRPVTDILDLDSIKRALDYEYFDYCERFCLCPECGAKLEKVKVYDDGWGKSEVIDIGYMCPNGD